MNPDYPILSRLAETALDIHPSVGQEAKKALAELEHLYDALIALAAQFIELRHQYDEVAP